MNNDVNIETILGRLDLTMKDLTVEFEKSSFDENEARRIAYEIYNNFLVYNHMLSMTNIDHCLMHTDLVTVAKILNKYGFINNNVNERK